MKGYKMHLDQLHSTVQIYSVTERGLGQDPSRSLQKVLKSDRISYKFRVRVIFKVRIGVKVKDESNGAF